VTVCEYLFENFDARGDDEHLERFSDRLDELFASGWKLLESRKDAAFRGFEMQRASTAPAGKTWAIVGDD
jgi:hypothetical protein